MEYTLELIAVPVSDVDVSKSFYIDRAGFDLLVDHRAGEDFRVVQLNPHGSACAIALMKNDDAAGSLGGLHLVVTDIEAAHTDLVGRGVEASNLFHFAATGQTDGPDPERQDYGTFFSFDDPDGNGWLVQEVPSRATK